MVSSGEIAVHRKECANGDGEIATITFSHPKSNSLPSTLLGELAATISKLGDDPSCRVVLLQSSGDRAFCAGASFDELVSIKTEADGIEFFSGFARVINAMKNANACVVTRVQGKAVGGAVGLIAASDYVVASSYGSVKLSELSVGIAPFVVGPVIEHKIGTAHFHNLTYDREWRTAEWARQVGLYAQVIDDPKLLDQAAWTLAEGICSCNPDAVRTVKQLSWQGTEHWAELLRERATLSGAMILSETAQGFLAQATGK